MRTLAALCVSFGLLVPLAPARAAEHAPDASEAPGAAERLTGRVHELRQTLRDAPLPVVREGRFASTTPRGQCPIEPQLQNYVGVGQVSVPGFTPTEEAAAILNAPADHYPIEIVAIAVGWSSPTGNALPSVEGSLRLYSAGLPSPGSPQFIAEGPVLADGAINEFDITGFPGNRIINSGPFMASLEILNASTVGGPAPVHDGAGCNPGESAVKVNGAFWLDNCTLGVSGQWVIHVKYRRVECDVITDCNNNGLDDLQEIAMGLADDCNGNMIPDECDIAAGEPDADGDGVPDICEAACPADLTGNGSVDAGDLAALIAAWGVCP